MQTGQPIYYCLVNGRLPLMPTAYRPKVEKQTPGSRKTFAEERQRNERLPTISIQFGIAGKHRLDAHKRQMNADMMYPRAIR